MVGSENTHGGVVTRCDNWVMCAWKGGAGWELVRRCCRAHVLSLASAA